MWLLKKRLNLKGFIEAGLETMKTTVTIFIIIAGAKIFGKAISLYRIPQDLSEIIVTNISDQGMFILVVCITLVNSWVYNGNTIINFNYDAYFCNFNCGNEY